MPSLTPTEVIRIGIEAGQPADVIAASLEAASLTITQSAPTKSEEIIRGGAALFARLETAGWLPKKDASEGNEEIFAFALKAGSTLEQLHRDAATLGAGKLALLIQVAFYETKIIASLNRPPSNSMPAVAICQLCGGTQHMRDDSGVCLVCRHDIPAEHS